MNDRVAIFIDGSNLYHSLKNNFGRSNLNYSEFAAKLAGSRWLLRTYYYNILQDQAQWPEGHREQQEFLDVLRRMPYLEVRLGTTKVSQGVAVERGIDIMVATDILNLAWRNAYDIAILVSGDSDFAYALQAVKNMGKQIEVAYFENAVSKDLVELADNKHILDRSFFTGLWAGKVYPRRRKVSSWRTERTSSTDVNASSGGI
jgi:uncharacterized LabA/DUF88 family protein